MRVRISYDPKLDVVVPKLDGFVERDIFDKFRLACQSGRASYKKERGRNERKPEGLPELVRYLNESGFEVFADQSAAKIMLEVEKERKEAASSASERASTLDEKLRAQGLALYPFQKDGVKWLAPRDRALLCDEMGLGKTIQILAALPPGAPVLVVAPAVVKGVWERETRKWRPDFVVTVLQGRKSFRYPRPGEVVVVNYDILPGEKPEGMKKPRTIAAPEGCPIGLVLVGDECHAVKSNAALRTLRFRGLSKAARSRGGKVWLLTATPLLNRPPELWSVLQAAGLEKDVFSTWERFSQLFNADNSGWGIEWGEPQPEVAPLLQRAMLRRERKNVLPDLPVKVWEEYDTGKPDAVAAAAADVITDALSRKGVALEDVEELSDLLDEGEGITLGELSAARAALAKSKIPFLLELVEDFEEAGEPIVVFSAHRAPIEKLGERKGWAVIMGGVASDKRTQIEDAFQKGQLKGLAATIDAGGVGITLTRAAHCIFVDKEWTPALNAQAEDRLCRIGQTRGVVIHTLIADHPLDRRVNALLDWKAKLIAGSVEAATQTEVVEPASASGIVTTEGEASVPVPPGTRSLLMEDPPEDEPTPDEKKLIARLKQLRGNGFAKTLVSTFEMYGELTAQQWDYARKLLSV